MDKKVEILLNSHKNVDSVDVDTYDKVELANKQSNILEYDVRNVASATEVFDAERQATQIYRIYGKIEYMSLLNGLKNNYSEFEDFFNPQEEYSKNLKNSFKFYLVKAGTGYTNITQSNHTKFKRYFEVIATPSEFELFDAGFANNVYGEQGYSFDFTVDIDISNYFDNFGFPATELFLYVEYIKAATETIRKSRWSTTTGNELTPTTFSTKPLNIGDVVETSTGVNIEDLIEYSEPNYYQVQDSQQIFYIRTPYDGGPERLQWKYNPFIPLRLQYLSNEVYRANTGNTVYEQVQSIPSFATDLGNGNFVWRNILDQGFIDPLTGIGVNYPFVNKRRYLYSNIVFSVVPDMNDTETRVAFEEVWYSPDAESIDITPLTDLDDIGKPCL